MIRLQEADRLLRAVRILPPEFQEILVLRFVCGMSHEQAGKIMKKRPGALRVLQHRALKALQQQMLEKETVDG